jgi:hypothetical protein
MPEHDPENDGSFPDAGEVHVTTYSISKKITYPVGKDMNINVDSVLISMHMLHLPFQKTPSRSATDKWSWTWALLMLPLDVRTSLTEECL